MELTAEMCGYIEEHHAELVELLGRLAVIPAPSFGERGRAEFCCHWLKAQGVENAYIDDRNNVIVPFGSDQCEDWVVFAAHSDVVFADTAPLPLVVEDDRMKCPGIGDDTANVAVLMMIARYICRHRLRPNKTGVLLVIDSCEEGLGNLWGIHGVLEKIGTTVQEFTAFDLYSDLVVNAAVGSQRYKICVNTDGGHSYND